MNNQHTELRAADLMKNLGRPLVAIVPFEKAEIVGASEKSIEHYFPKKIHFSLVRPRQYVFLGEQVEELHFTVNDSGEVLAIFVEMENNNLVKKLTGVAGNYITAAGASMQDNDALSFYSWNYEGGCIDLTLSAHKFRLNEKIVRDTGLMIFNKCNPLSYLTMPVDSTQNH